YKVSRKKVEWPCSSGSIGLACDRADQTALSRFVSGHLRSCSFSHGNKVFPVCAKCGIASASPEHILSCLRLSRETFETDPLLALDFLRVSGLMDGGGLTYLIMVGAFKDGFCLHDPSTGEPVSLNELRGRNQGLDDGLPEPDLRRVLG
ncbi:hypothetical protein AVEN_120642-1, partial [Araneus ventricosus]